MLSNHTLSMRGMNVATGQAINVGAARPAIKKITSADISETVTDDTQRPIDKKEEESTKQETDSKEKSNSKEAIVDALKFSVPLKNSDGTTNRWEAANPAKPVSQDELVSKLGFSKPNNPASQALSQDSTSTPQFAQNGGSGLPFGGNTGGNSNNNYPNNSWNNQDSIREPRLSTSELLSQLEDHGLIEGLELQCHRDRRGNGSHLDGKFELNGASDSENSAIVKTLQNNGYQVAQEDGSCTFTGKEHSLDTNKPKPISQEKELIASTDKESSIPKEIERTRDERESRSDSTQIA